MAHTKFHDDRTLVLPGRVAAYSPRDNGDLRLDWSTNFEKVGDGGLMSSVDDMLLWDRNFYDNKLGKGTLLRELQMRGTLNSGKTISYALGLTVSAYKGLPIVEHGGALFGYRTEILRFPEQRFSVVCLCNLSSANPGAKARQIADIYLAGQMSPADVSQEEPPKRGNFVRSKLSRFDGIYRDPNDRSFVTVSAREGGLYITNPLVEPATVVKAANPTLFVDPRGEEYRFEASANGGTRMFWRVGHGTEHVLERIRPVQLTDAELTSYTGNYPSDELRATYKIRNKDGKLMVMVGWNDPIELQPSLHDEFQGRLSGEFREPIVIQFLRTDDKVVGFDLFAGFADGVRDIRFVKQ
jgi:hypothetical protein